MANNRAKNEIKSKKLFKIYRVDKNLRLVAAAAAYEPVQKLKVTLGIPGWLYGGFESGMHAQSHVIVVSETVPGICRVK